MILGSHVSFSSNQLLGSCKEAISYGANTFMFYTGAPQNTVRKDIDDAKTYEAFKYMQENGIDIKNVICHAPYIINLANRENESAWNFSCSFLKQEIERITRMNIRYIVVHPGNSLKMERIDALKNIADALNMIITNENLPMILLETMAGKGTECGKNISELKFILEKVNYKEKVGICLDTCHLNDSGVDIANIQAYLDEFSKEIGLDKIKCIHLNDSKNPLGSHKDRHENIGFGTIGFDSLLNICLKKEFQDIPIILETPYINGYPPYKFEINMLRKGCFNKNLINDVNTYYERIKNNER